MSASVFVFATAPVLLVATAPVAQACAGCGVGTSPTGTGTGTGTQPAASPGGVYGGSASLPPQSPPQDPNAGKVTSLGTASATPSGQQWTGCPAAQSTEIAWPANGAPSVADVNSGVDVIWPQPLPNGGSGYTWGCFTGTVFSGTPPSAPAQCEVSSDLDRGRVTITSQSVSPFLAGDRIVSHVGGAAAPPDSTQLGSAGNYTYAMLTRWTGVADHPDRWNWNDGTITDGESDGTGVHAYSNVSGSGNVPAHGVTISVTRWWQPLCSTQVIDTTKAPGSPGYFVRNEPLGSTGCHASKKATLPLAQTFLETTPLAPHLVRQIESVPIAP